MSISPGIDGPTESVTVSELLTRAARGALALGARQVMVTALGVVGAATLARLVAPAVFGVFAIGTFVVGFLNFFAEAGLGASIIRQKTVPTERELQSAFTLQLLLSLVVLVGGWFLATPISHAVSGVPHTETLIRLGLLSLVVSAGQLVPSALLERDLKFSRLGAINVAQAFTYNGVAIAFAAAGAPVIGVGVALILQAVVGVTLLAVVRPWHPGFALRGAALKARLRFSIPLQLSSVLSSLKDAIAPLFVGTLLGARAVGLVEWSNAFAAYPVLALMAFQQIYLPTFSRLQDDPPALGRAADNVLRGTNMIVAPLAALTFALAAPITHVVFGDKWLTALPTFRLFWIANVFVATASPLFSLLYARGRSVIALNFTLLWMAGTWALGVPLIHVLGIKGYGLANVGVQLTNLLLFRIAKREAPIHLFAQFWRPWLAAGLVASVVYLISRSSSDSVAALAAELLGGLVVYVLVMWRLEATTFRKVLVAMRSSA